MKKVMMAAMLAAALAVTMGGPALAAGKHQTPEAFIPNAWQYEGTVEAGILPKGEDISKAELGGNEGFALKEYGGIVYRVGVDTN